MGITEQKLIIVIPFYNHAGTLQDIVKKALSVNEDVIVVDDGSDEKASDILQGFNVHIIRHERNMGKGAATLTGAQEARRLGMTHIVTIDADGQHDPADLKGFYHLLHEDENAILVGKRIFKKGNVPGVSQFGRRFSNFWFRLQTSQALGDTQSGFRVYPLAVLEKLKLREKRFSFEVEVLVRAAWAGVKIKEVEISVFYPSPEERISHFRIFKDNLLISILNFKFTMRSIAPIPHHKILLDEKSGDVITVFHPIRSLKTLLTENTSTEKLVMAVFLGVFLGALPLIACHTVVIIFFASFFQLNKVVALSASQLCMPPIVPAICIEVGYFIRHGRFLTEVSIETIGYQALDRFFEWCIGSLLVGPGLGFIVGGICYVMILFVKRGRCAINR